MGEIWPHHGVVGGDDVSLRRVEGAGQFVKGNVVHPLVLIVPAGHRHGTVAGGTDRDTAGGLVADVALHVGVDKVLAGHVPVRKRLPELLPVAGTIQEEDTARHRAGLERRPRERQWLPAEGPIILGATGHVVDDGAVVGDAREYHHRLLLPGDGDLLAHDLHIQPLPLVLVLVGVFRIDPLDEQVLYVRPQVRDPPGNVVVVADDDAGVAGEGETDHVVGTVRPHRIAVEADLVPDGGHLYGQVGVVGQEGHPRLGAVPGDDPVVAPQACPEQSRGACPGPQGLEGGLGHRLQRRPGQRVGDDDRVVVRVGGHQFAHGGGSQPGGDAGAQQFGVHIAPQVPGHHLGPGESVEGGPGLWLELDAGEPQDGELQPQPAPVGGDVTVDPLGVGLQRHPRLGVQLSQFLGGGAVPPQGANEAIGVQRGFTQYLGQPPGADAPRELHLPETILGVDVPLGEEEIVGVGGIDVGDAPTIADDGHLRLQTVRVERAIGLGPRAAHGEEAVASNQPQHQHDDGDYSDDLGQCTHGSPSYRVLAMLTPHVTSASTLTPPNSSGSITACQCTTLVGPVGVEVYHLLSLHLGKCCRPALHGLGHDGHTGDLRHRLSERFQR